VKRLSGGLFLTFFFTGSAAWASTLSVCPSGCAYSDLQTALATANTGDVVSVGPGTYTAVQSGAAGHLQGLFDVVNNGVTVVSTNGAASTILQASNSGYPTVRIQGNNSVFDGFTVQGAPLAVEAFSQTAPTHPITGIVIRNVIANPVVSSSIGNGQGILLNQTSNSTVEKNDIKNGYQSGISLQGGSTNNFIINNTIEQTNNTTGYDIVLYQGCNGNVVAGNLIMNSGFGGLTIVGSSYNRVERNSFSGSWASVTLTDDPNHVPSNANFVGNNNLQSTDFATGKTYGTGVWLNNNSTGNFVFNNILTGFIENSIAIFNSTSNLIRGNYSYHNQQGGLDMTTDPGALPAGLAPVNNVIQHNVFTDLQFNALFYISKSGSNDIGFNVTSTGPTTQVSGSESTHIQTSINGINFYHNTLIDLIGNTTTINVASSDVTNTRIFMNRIFGTAPYYQFSTNGNSASWDGGAHLGGNFWSGFSANGDPSDGSTPFTNFNGGSGTDHYPYQHETYGKAITLQVTQPNSSTAPIISAGSTKSIAWVSAGCVYVDISYKRSTGSPTYIVQNYPDGGYYNWSVPSNLAAGSDYQLQIDCKSFSQALTGVSSSGLPFAVTSNNLILLSPNSGAMTNAGSPLMVAWSKGSGITGVDILYSTGSGYSLLAANVSNDSTTVTLPGSVNSNQVSLLIRDSNNSGNADSTDGFITSRGGSPQFTSPSGVSTLAYGTEVPVQWISPVNSVYVNISLVINGSTLPIATNLADFGQYSWLVSDNVGTGGYLQITFEDINLTNLGTVQSGTFAVAATQPASSPSVVSLSPNSGTSTAQVFTAVFSDTGGANFLADRELLIGSSASSAGACLVDYNSNGFYLTNDAGSAQLGPIPGGSGSLSNSQCTLNGSGSGVANSGNNSTVTYSVTFNSGYAGTKNLYLYAGDTLGSNTGFVTKGSFTVLSAPSVPSPTSVTPSSGANTAQTFTATYSDSAGAGYLNRRLLMINAALNGTGACFVQTDQTGIYLINDGDSALLGPLTGSATLSNSQCTLNGTGSSMSNSGSVSTLTLSISFKAVFAGAKTIFMYADDTFGNASNWVTKGSFTVLSAPSVPTSTSVTPSSGANTAQTFTATYSDAAGAAYLNRRLFIINGALNGSGACFVQVDTTGIYLINDADSALLGPLTGGATLANSQCILNGTGTSVSNSGIVSTLTLSISFKAAFAGAKSIFMYADDDFGNAGNWVMKGSYTVLSAPSVPMDVSVSPSSASGMSQTFTAVYSDAAGASYLNRRLFLINSALNGSGACFVQTDTTGIYLLNDADSALLGPLNGSNSFSTSQCTLSGTGSSVVNSGSTSTVTLAITFAPAFNGAKNVYMYADDSFGNNSGFKTAGTYTVSAVASTPTVTSVTPNSGSGTSRTFTLVYSDPAGNSLLNRRLFLINSSLVGSGACFVEIDPNGILLADDADSSLTGPLFPNGALTNSQCTVNGAGASVSYSATGTTVVLPIVFKAGFAGTRNIYMYVDDTSGNNSGWQLMGSITTQ
jgi:parallel beta-helix repeat protein